MTRSPEPPAGLFSLFKRAPGTRQPLKAAGTWPPADRAKAYEAFFRDVRTVAAGGELFLFDDSGAIACSMRVAIVRELPAADAGAIAARVFGVER